MFVSRSLFPITAPSVTDEQFVIGCYQENNMWKIFKTKERSGHYIFDELTDENEAFDELYELVRLQEKYVKNNNF